MKKIKFYALLLLATVAVFGCSKYDDSELRNDVNDLKSRVEKLETWCNTVNGQISALQGLISALEANDYVTGVSPIMEGSKEMGYTITFTKSSPITIMHGKDGVNGIDGVTPVIGVKQDTDGHYYWTVQVGSAAATWMLDAAGNKIRTTGDNGDDGTNGKDGHTPVLSVGTDPADGKVYWKVDGEWLLDNGQKVQATGDKGATGAQGPAGPSGPQGVAGADGDAVFAEDGINLDNADYVEFTLVDGTTFKLQRTGEIQIFDSFSAFVVTPVKNEIVLLLPSTMKETDYTAIKAEITSIYGVGIDIKTRASSTPWSVEITKPTFDNGTLVAGSAKVTVATPAGIADDEVALLKVTIIDNNGQEHAATRVLKYSNRVNAESVSLDKDVLSIAEGKTATLVATVLPANASDKSLSWSSSNESVVTVDADGKVTAKAMGTATITATTTDGGFTADCVVTVTEAEKGYSWYVEGKASGAFELSSVEELKEFALLVNGDADALAYNGAIKAVSFEGMTVKIADSVTELDLNSEEWTPIGNSLYNPFSGVFDGNGKVFKNIKIDQPETNYRGLFGYVKSGVLQNITLSGNIIGGGTTAGIVGRASGTCIKACVNKADVIGSGTAGGIVGNAEQTSSIIACENYGQIDAGDTSGGIVGSPRATQIIACINHGNVKTSMYYAGGIASYATGTGIFACLSECTVDAFNGGGGIAGRLDLVNNDTYSTNYFVSSTPGLKDLSSSGTQSTSTYANINAAVGTLNNAISAWNSVNSGACLYRYQASTGDNLPTLVAQ